MKKYIRLFYVILFLCLQGISYANRVIVKGIVKDSSNHPIANKSVKIYSTDSSNHGCLLSHTVLTNPNGYYIDTLSCNGDIRKLLIIVENCNGTKISHDPNVSSTGIVESNFIICSSTSPRPINPNCRAVFAIVVKDAAAQFNSKESSPTYIPGTAPDSIISRTWTFGDGSAPLTGNRIDPVHIYAKPGLYQVKLVIKTKNGCESSYSLQVHINGNTIPPIPTNCKAFFSSTVNDSIVQFNSLGSLASTTPGTIADSIISRTWYFMDNYPNTFQAGNIIDPTYVYAHPGTYSVTLVIKTQKGCESKFSALVTTKAPVAPIRPTSCKAYFHFTIMDGIVKFNSAESKAASAQDSIISRYWIFGETSNTTTLQGNRVDPTHIYTRPGKYIVYLYIKTKQGCESKFTDTVVITKVNCSAEAQFNIESIGLKKVNFNSSLSKAQPGDSITQRIWKFGDNSSLTGNIIDPSKEYPVQGIYTACLQIKTRNGCEAQMCKQITVQDTVSRPNIAVDFVKIVSINPNPVVSSMRATIYSSNKDIECEITVYDIYGSWKISLKKLLAQGNNIIEIETANLYHGPYFLRVKTKNGLDTKVFYKL